MKINLILFVSSVKEKSPMATLMKTFESNIRPCKEDIIADPGFDADFHNGYEVAKVTIDYHADECWVSLSPLAIEKEEITCTAYIEKLKNNGWKVLTKEMLSPRK
ncbi:hypothetical protein FZC84_00365 [Rossellomorea vietnamensis]|uniref:Uncharacterized protein n=1 Tax=Rossellomorea vietnamensis TaxID=218284 RepID=A0A5D4MID9_9BACI|nr:hypothetical protein [Rossellomorea vietnamensis]TYS01159.1 hypothetical protein FZC84_00365 [Rossellomorea vietnamensis]